MTRTTSNPGSSLEDNLLVIPRRLAAVVGTNAAMVLNQIHYWLNHADGYLLSGVKWIYNSIPQWLEQLPLSRFQFRSAIAKLKDLGLIMVEQLEKHRYQRQYFYTINYGRLKEVTESTDMTEGLKTNLRRSTNCTIDGAETEPSTIKKVDHREFNNCTIDSEETEPSYKEQRLHTEITPENTTNSEVVFSQKLSKAQFDRFWALYPIRAGIKSRKHLAFSAFCQLPAELFPKIINALQQQIAAQKLASDRNEFSPALPDPLRWLQEQRWDDEVQLPDSVLAQIGFDYLPESEQQRRLSELSNSNPREFDSKYPGWRCWWYSRDRYSRGLQYA